VGEYAVTNGFGNLGNMHAALGEAVYMMGMENNSDVVPLNSYAPIFVNENDAKWRPDMIRFNSHQVMGTPSYYVQMLMPQHLGTQVVRVRQQNPYSANTKPITPAQSRIGFSTWGTNATFKAANDGGIDFVGKGWQQNGDGTVSHTAFREGSLAICKTPVDGRSYTVKLRARKDRGHEGFLIVFNYVDERNYCWLNFGGWGNTQHAIEQISGGGKIQSAYRRGSVEEGRWYDITLQVDGDHVKAWLDSDLVFDADLKHDTSKGIYSSATIDDRTGELIVKLVNNGDESTTARLDLKHFQAREARVVRLQANDGMDENTLQQPTNIAPREQQLSPEPDHLLLDLPAYSLNIVRIKQ
jgi:alpha-L-arabinofuranosidase